AEKAGLKENDVIVSFNGRRVDSVRELQRLRSETPAGRTVSIEVIRGGNKLTLNATLSKRSQNTFVFRPDGSFEIGKGLGELFPKMPDFGTFNFSFPRMFGSYRGTRLGVSVETISDQLAEYFGVKTRQGLLITEVIDNTPASRAGLKAGDVIVAVDNKTVEGMNTLLDALNKEEGPLTLTIVRDRVEQTVTVMLEKRIPRPSRGRIRTVSTSTSAA
ncbi:MAG TPA: PDZ domain-containing protein, partial [Blastocatellia bacterium]|nr:PDZ domain-containing protein [Blastocatellia bacterium]